MPTYRRDGFSEFVNTPASIDSGILKSGRSCYFQPPPGFSGLDYATTEKESAKTIPDYFIASSSEHLPTMAALVQRDSRHNH
jgi:hypothetical protein